MFDYGCSVIVPTLNRNEHLLPLLSDLSKQTFKPIEIIIVEQSDMLNYTLVRFVEEHKEIVNLFHVDFKSLPKARNFGVEKSKYRYILFLDDDTRCAENIIEKHVTIICKDDIGVCGGGVDEKPAKPNNNKLPKYRKLTSDVSSAEFSNMNEGYADHIKGCNFSVKKEAFLRCGGFDETLSDGPALFEDAEFCLKASKEGYKIYYNGKARVKHLHAAKGGCRINDISLYVYALARNRIILFRRYSLLQYFPIAFCAITFQVLKYSMFYRSIRVLKAGLGGLIEGVKPKYLIRRCGKFDMTIIDSQ